MEETGVPGENHRPVASHGQTLSHKILSSAPRHEWDSNTQLGVTSGAETADPSGAPEFNPGF